MLMVKKASKKRTSAKKLGAFEGGFEPTKVSLAVASAAVVSLLLLGLLTTTV